jgi:hypothetical protein
MRWPPCGVNIGIDKRVRRKQDPFEYSNNNEEASDVGAAFR